MQIKTLKSKKRIICVIAVVFVLLASFGACLLSLDKPVSVFAEEPVWTIENGAIVSYSGDEKEITIPSEISGEPVTQIANSAFYENTTIEKVIIPDSITSIGKNAFQKCSKLKTVVLGDGITKIDDYTFEHCVNLAQINIPNGVKQIGTWAFGFCLGLEKIEFPNGIEDIGSASFYGCNTLNNVVMPDSVTTIGTHSFRGCANLENVTFSKNLKSIPYRAFDRCPIKEVVLPPAVKTIALEAFYESGVEKVTISNETEKIEDRAFYGSKKLKEINLPTSLSYLGESAFEGCITLQRAVIPNGITIIKTNTFKDCKKLASVVLPHNLVEIQQGAFDGCDRLVEVYNPSSLQIEQGSELNGKISINAKVVHSSFLEPSRVVIDKSGFIFYDDGGDRAIFLGYSGESYALELPDKVGEKPYDIEKNAFKGETNLNKIVIPTCVKVIGENAFSECSKSLRVVYAGNWSSWQEVRVELGNDCLDTILFLGSDKNTTNQGGNYDTDESERLSFLDKMYNVWNEFISIIVSNIFVVNFLLVLFWGAVLIYNGKSEKNKKIFVIIVCVQWILISGLRADSVGADTENYMNFFDHHAKLSWRNVFAEIKSYFTTKQTSSDPYLGIEPLFVLFNKLVSVVTTNHVIYKFIVAIIFTTALGRYVYKYSEDPCLSFAIYGCLFYNMFSLTGYRQVLAVTICVLWGYRYIRERKLIPFLILLIVGTLIHKSLLVFGVFYFLANKKITPKYLFICVVAIVTLLLFSSRIFSTLKNIFGYEEYAGGYGFSQWTFFIFFLALTVVSVIKYRDVLALDKNALHYYNGLILAWIVFPLLIEDPSVLRLLYTFAFVLLPLVPLVLKTFNCSGKDKSIIYLCIYLVFFVQTLTSGVPYAVFWR